MRLFVFGCSLAVGLILASCSSFDGDLSRKYTQAARSIGVNPVYPPREEFQIGDVYLVSSIPNNPDSSVSVWLGTMDNFRIRANNFLKSRVVFQDTGAGSSATPSSQPLLAQTDMFEPGVTTRNDERVDSLPIAAFPSITTQAGTTASAGLVGAMAALGLGVSDQTMVTLDFNDVRTYWVPQVLLTQGDIDQAIVEYGGEKLDLGARELPSKIAAKELMDGHKWSGSRCLQLAIVTRVYLTRQIQYTYADRQIIAAGLKAAAQQGQLAQVSAPPAVNVTVLQSAGDASKNPDTTASIAESLRQSTTPSGTGAEGGSFSFVSWNARGLTFQQTYQRPVAIGWEGLEFDADPVGIPGHRDCHLGVGGPG